MGKCQHKLHIQITSGKEVIIEFLCEKCAYYFVMTEGNYHRILKLKKRIDKMLILKKLE